MRHNFVNDIGDYAKYALLRAVCQADPGLHLGIIWYLTEHSEQNGDGRRRAHLQDWEGWRQLDPTLLAELRRLDSMCREPADLHVSVIQQSAVLPSSTAYYSAPLPSAPSSRRGERLASRKQWFQDALAAMEGCDVVFIDPDNGVEVPSVPPGQRLSAKYAYAYEVGRLLAQAPLVVVYQHGDRSPWMLQRAKVEDVMRRAIGAQPRVQCMRFSAHGARAFFCVSRSQGMSEVVDAAFRSLSARAAGWSHGQKVSFD